MTEEGRKVAELCKGPERHRIMQLCDDIDRLAAQLADLQRRGLVKINFYAIFLALINYLPVSRFVTFFCSCI